MASINTSAKVVSWKTSNSRKDEWVKAILIALFLVLAGTFSIREHDPPAALPATVSPEIFSANRAFRHLSVIAEKPHPIGSTEHAVVRDYLMRELSAAGVEPQIQQATIAVRTGPPLEMAVVQNVLARLKGTTNSTAVLVVAHYDSVTNSFGASDDGAGVASLLETLRALRAGPPLKNDLIFLFTDAEEKGLLGARAFVAEHPWAKDVRVVLNFDARGNTGPVIMFESSDNNGWLIEQFAEASPFPVGHSLSYELFKLLPNDTDLTVFRKAGMAGLNFANIDGISQYHTERDDLQNVDLNSLQHRGSHALALTRHFASVDLGRTTDRNAVYFDLFGNVLVRYSSIWVIPLTLFVTALFVIVLSIGLRNKKLTIRGISWGFVSLLVSIAVASLCGWLAWKALQWIRGGVSAETTQSRLLLIGFVAMAMAITLTVYALTIKRTKVENMLAGTLFGWLILMVVTSLFLPGGSFLFHWPLFFSVIALGWMILAPESKKTTSLLHPLILGLCAIPCIVLVIPIIYQIFVGLTLNWISLVLALVVLLAGLLMPQLRLIAANTKWALAALLAGLAVALLVAGTWTNRGNSDRTPNIIYYALNADTGKAVWAAADLTRRDERASALFNGSHEKGTLADFAYAKTSREYNISSAPVATLPAPEMKVLENRVANGVRTVRLRLLSPRQAGMLSVFLDSKAHVSKTILDNKTIEDDEGARGAVQSPEKPWGLHIDGFPQEGVELQLQLTEFEPLKIRLVDRSYGLPALGASTNSHAITAQPDLTLLTKSFSL